MSASSDRFSESIAQIWSARIGAEVTADQVKELVAIHEAFPRDTLHERLTWAVEGWASQSEHRQGREGAARTFRRAMSERLIPGRSGESYRAVLTYLNGSSEPSLAWIRTAADLLGVTPAWLAFGDMDWLHVPLNGGMLDAEQAKPSGAS